MKIIETKKFFKSFKRLSKKYKKLVYDYEKLVDVLESNSHNATQITDNIYKIRLQNSSNPKGKSAGFRVVYFLKIEQDTIYLLDIFSKSETTNIEKHKLLEMQNALNI
ncbi:MAG: type II toxin-antitoxin system RelE/ParE family toxin [Candidatus Thioglobus sp.]|uniref:type II toxin-antitoxin system RelE/ParE family toxin n=1 Tax=Candidatus Thioglobus sp. TaxID=2026721 RepID=UPI00262F0812|nr:type II toxin-antitoxin system RelE/ParE family toxin [Candidatus Thioglobus sp.]MDC9726777.1 type II toxin-antitoxin system RelE/ParE family toxin [Candidatus Thioglobus sp.]